MTYYFAVTAYDLSGNESAPSPEVSTHIAEVAPAMVSPPPGAALTTTTTTFQWSPGSGVDQYWLGVGTSLTAVTTAPWGDIFGQSTGTTPSATVSGIPLTGNPVFVRLWWRIGTTWSFSDPYTYQTQGAGIAGIAVTPTTGLTTTEAGGTATFTVALSTLPTANVSIGLSSSDFTEGTVSPSSLTFTPANGTTPQTVTVTGVEDALSDGNLLYTIITAPATSTDGAYNGLNAADVSVTNTDRLMISTLSVAIAGNGSVTSGPAGIRCTNGTCTASYGSGSTITLIAQADKRWKFAGWSGGCSGTGECVVQLTTNQFVGATFSQNGNGKGRNK